MIVIVCCMFDYPFVMLHTECTERRLNEATAHG
jgi:hypothetical protein